MTHHHAEQPHSQQQAQAAVDGSMWTADFWDGRYAGSPAVWSGKPNRRLVEQVTGLAPGTALDVGCGEGADAVWLAQHGWRTTGIDVSRVALDRAAGHAADAGVEVEWRQVDVVAGEALPASYDLVTAHFFHPPVDRRGDIVRRLGEAVEPGGTLLYVGHDPSDAEALHRDPALTRLMPTLEEVVALLDPAAWDLRVAEVQAREQLVEGEARTLHDAVVRAVRIR